jgi:hypothetical protein
MEMALVLRRPCSVMLAPQKGLGPVLNRGVVKGCRAGSCGTRARLSRAKGGEVRAVSGVLGLGGSWSIPETSKQGAVSLPGPARTIIRDPPAASLGTRLPVPSTPVFQGDRAEGSGRTFSLLSTPVSQGDRVEGLVRSKTGSARGRRKAGGGGH